MNFFVTLSILFLIVYAITITSFALGWFKLNYFKHTIQPVNESVSIVIACRNEEENIDPLIQSLLQQDYPKEKTEIIVVDDHSEDNTYFTLKNYAARHKQLKILQNPDTQHGKKAALVYGIQHALSEIIVTTDADCRIGKKWLSVLIAYYNTHKPKMLIAPVALEPLTNIFTKFQALEFTSLIISGAGAAGINKPIMCNGANLLFEKLLFNKNALHSNYASGDDIFLLLQAKKENSRDIHFIKSRDAIVYTNPNQSLSGFFNQRIRWASKSKAYRDFDIIITALTVAASNFILAFWLIHTIFRPNDWYIFTFLFAIKSLADLLILIPGTRFFHQQTLFWLFLPLQIIYPFYIVITTFLGWLANFWWKGRKLR
ncbi:MAG: glycosyltransferase [Bacteroidota bacterium]|nr:glycosyltransferase [Bacteroidota bacterium]